MPSPRPSTGATPRIGLPAALLCYSAFAVAGAAALVAALDPAFAPPGDAARAPSAPGFADLALNLAPTLLLAWLLLALTRRPAWSLGVSLLLLHLLYAANELKFTLLDTPVLPSDFVLLGHLGDGGALLLQYVPPATLAALLAAGVCAVALAWVEQPWRRLRGWRRWALVGATAALCASLAGGVRPWTTVYGAEEAGFHQWSPADSALRCGLPSTLVRYGWHTDFVLPEPDRAVAADFLRRHPHTAVGDAAGERPDIVVLQSESFFDPARLRGLEPEQALPELRRLAAHARHGELWVPAYGGGTIRTEFEVLTGIAMRYFPEIEYPYFRLTATPLPSLASVLAARGYRTIAVHPHKREFWNRSAAFANLGFAEFDDDTAFGDAARIGYFIADDALVDRLLARLGESSSPTFLFAISMENHGPYESYPNADEAEIARQPVPPGLSGSAARELRGYLHHLARADRALGRLADALRQRPRRTLLLFYGDHLPAMPDIYARGAGFDDGERGRRQPVPWLLFDSAHPDEAPAEATAAFYLPALLLDAAGIDEPYFGALDAARRDDRPAAGWTPVDDAALRALMLMRQRGEMR